MQQKHTLLYTLKMKTERALFNKPFLRFCMPLICFALSAYPAVASAYGDIEGNGRINLADAILSLQACVQPFIAEPIDLPKADVNNDGRIGTEEAVYTLQVLASIKPSPYAPKVAAGADRTIVEGMQYSLDSATFIDSGAISTHTAIIDWGDGSPIAEAIVDETAHTIWGLHTYTDNGTYTVTVTVTDDDGAAGKDTLTVTVDNSAPIIEAGANQTAVEKTQCNLELATFTDSGSEDIHTVIVDWGDGTPVATVCHTNNTVLGSHVYWEDGTYTVTVSVIDDDGAVASDALTVEVAANLDADKDGYDIDNGDCNDDDPLIYLNAPDSCGDGIDQDCNGADPSCPAALTYANEDFASDAGGFSESSLFSLSNGCLLHQENVDQTYESLVTWNGGSNPSGNWFPEPTDSNYFTDFHVSVDMLWEGGSNGYYGLHINRGKDRYGDGQYLQYYRNSTGLYQVYWVVDGKSNWIYPRRSFLRSPPGQPNNIGIEKEGDVYRFYLNGTEIERLTIKGFAGGGVGLQAHPYTTVSFDNFKITNPLRPSPSGMSEPHVTTLDLNEYVYKVMTGSYYWYKEVPSVNPAAYDSPTELLEALRYKPFDERFSYITTRAWYYGYYDQGVYLGMGLGWEYDQHNDLRISYVYLRSPADKAGLTRGDKILEINCQPVKALDAHALYDFIMSILDDAEDGESVSLKVEKTSGALHTIQLKLTEVTVKPVLHTQVIVYEGMKIGYLVFQDFIEPAFSELDIAFSRFASEGIDELILDLRYNPGGYTEVAHALATRISGTKSLGYTFLHYEHNDKYTDWDSTANFEALPNMLDLDSVVVITTASTCSASEAIINTLKPYIEVATVGTRTCGKPVGMYYGYDFYWLHITPIEFKAVNADGKADYFDGISPTCMAADGLAYDFGNPEEDSLAEALRYITTGTCSSSKRAKVITQKKMLPLRGFRREIGSF